VTIDALSSTSREANPVPSENLFATEFGNRETSISGRYVGVVRWDQTSSFFLRGPVLFLLSIHRSTAIGAAFTAVGGAFASLFCDEATAECGETCF